MSAKKLWLKLVFKILYNLEQKEKIKNCSKIIIGQYNLF
jgi:hypothetical protein